jgi:N-acetylmuramoyl-L-alanine amidase
MRFRSLAAAAVACALAPASASAAVHTVSPGETLSGIAAVNGLSPAAVAAANGLDPDDFVIAGTNLTIPAAGAAPAAAPATTQSAPTAAGYQVVPGDSLSAIAARMGVSRAALAAANGLSPDGWVIAGTRLKAPAAGTGTAAASSAGAPEAMGGYTVRAGDTLGALAARSRVPLAQMAAMNGLDPNKPLLIGTALKLPTGSPVLAAAPAPTSAVAVPGTNPAPTAGRLDAGTIGSIASANGVPASLASAIAWQESGFNNAMVSSANARGIMQVMPGTWAWVQQNLSSAPLNPASAADNVRAGSLYLGSLLKATNGDPAMAAAGYYQGLDSVRRIGMLPETRQYVANVLALRSRFGG